MQRRVVVYPPNCGDGSDQWSGGHDEGALNSDTWSLFEQCNTECSGKARIAVMALSMAVVDGGDGEV